MNYKNGELIDTGFADWKNAVGQKRGTFNIHSESDVHSNATVAAENYIKVCSAEMKPINSFISSAYAEKVERNRKILESLIDIILLCAQRGFPLRGNWNTEDTAEDGNFIQLTIMP